MGTFKTFQNIEAWQKARVLANRIYDVSGSGLFSRDFGLRDQIRRAGISVMSNIAEGFEGGGSKEFVRFLSIAKGSIGELKSQLYIALDQKYVVEDVFSELFGLADEIGKMMAGLMSYLRLTNVRVSKHE